MSNRFEGARCHGWDGPSSELRGYRSVEALAASGRFDVVAGPSDLWGARGQGRGLYVRDPDGNVIELRTYEPGGSGCAAGAAGRASAVPP